VVGGAGGWWAVRVGGGQCGGWWAVWWVVAVRWVVGSAAGGGQCGGWWAVRRVVAVRWVVGNMAVGETAAGPDAATRDGAGSPFALLGQTRGPSYSHVQRALSAVVGAPPRPAATHACCAARRTSRGSGACGPAGRRRGSTERVAPAGDFRQRSCPSPRRPRRENRGRSRACGGSGGCGSYGVACAPKTPQQAAFARSARGDDGSGSHGPAYAQRAPQAAWGQCASRRASWSAVARSRGRAGCGGARAAPPGRAPRPGRAWAAPRAPRPADRDPDGGRTATRTAAGPRPGPRPDRAALSRRAARDRAGCRARAPGRAARPRSG
jgi:hypothetical protein